MVPFLLILFLVFFLQIDDIFLTLKESNKFSPNQLNQIKTSKKDTLLYTVKDKSNQTEIKYFSDKSVNTEHHEVRVHEKKLTERLKKIDDIFVFRPPVPDFEVKKFTTISQSDQLNQSSPVNFNSNDAEKKIKNLERKCKEYEAMIQFKDKVLMKRETDCLQIQEELKDLKNKYDLIKPLIKSMSQSKNNHRLCDLTILDQDKVTVNNNLFSLESKKVEDQINTSYLNRIRRSQEMTNSEASQINLHEEYLKRFAKAPVSNCLVAFETNLQPFD